jgi:hypothetical protein
MRELRWKPSTYRQIWIDAVLGFGVPGSVSGHSQRTR